MEKLAIDSYQTKKRKIHWWYKYFTNLFFWPSLLRILLKSSRLGKKGRYDEEAWVDTSLSSINLLEKLGVKFHIENFQVLENLTKPCLFIGNHMSTMDAFIFPCIIRPFVDFTFVGKASLLTAPLLRDIMDICDPIIVGRQNPREDLKAILTKGQEHLENGKSILIFPQATRAEKFDPKKFNSIGVKLAKKAGVPIIPVALCTNAWTIGKRIKNLGKIKLNKPVHVCFGEPITVGENPKDAQNKIVNFILQKLELWLG